MAIGGERKAKFILQMPDEREFGRGTLLWRGAPGIADGPEQEVGNLEQPDFVGADLLHLLELGKLVRIGPEELGQFGELFAAPGVLHVEERTVAVFGLQLLAQELVVESVV